MLRNKSNTMKIAIYARVSTNDQNLDSQLQECREWCAHNKMTAVEYLDVMSGASTSREALNRMMADARRGRVKTVLCYKLDRLGRSVVHITQIIAEFDHLGVALVCPSQGIDTRVASPGARFQLQILAAVAELERTLIQERTLAGLKAAKARGVKLGRPERPEVHAAFPAAREAVKNGQSVRAAAKAAGMGESTLRFLLARQRNVA